MLLGFGQIVLLTTGGVFSALAFCVLQALHHVYVHPLRKYPGPKAWAATRLIWVFHEFKGDLIFRLKELHDKYGPIVRIAPDELSFISPAAWKDIYGPSGSKELARDIFIFPPSLPELPNGILYVNQVEHTRIRRQISYAFSAKALEEQQPLIQSHVDVLIKQLRAKNEPVDMASWFNFASFDIIADLSFGEQFRCLEEGKYHPYAAMMMAAFKTAIFSSALNRYGLLPVASRLLPPSLVRQRDMFVQMTKDLCRKRLDQKTDRPDFISYLLKADKSDATMTAEELTSNALTIVIAGSESTGSLLAGTVYYLVRNPDKLARVSQEVRTAFRVESEISSTTAAKLPYMLACLEEGLRIATPAPFGVARRTAQPTMIAGELVPANVSVNVPQFAAWHIKSNFARPNEFIPERWLSDDPEFANDIKAGFYPFGTGPRNCIGKNLAYLEMRLILARVLWNFDLELADDSFSWTKQKAYLVWEKDPLMIHVRNAQRESS